MRKTRAPRKKRTPTDERPKGIDRNRMRQLQDERERERHERIERLLTQIANRSRDENFGEIDALMELEEARMVALNVYPPQAMAAVRATEVKARIMGLIVDRSHAIQQQGPLMLRGSVEEHEQAVIERLRERVGSRGADAFVKFISDMRKAYRGDDGEDSGDDQ